MSKALLIAAVLLFAAMITNEAVAQVKKDESLRREETRATLDPKTFSEPIIRKAYQAAKEIPWVIDSIYCYCMCEESPAFKHKSLLSCYVDNHAAV